MANDSSMSVRAATKHAREHPEDAAEAIQSLFDHVEAGGDEVRGATTSLVRIAKEAPASFAGQTERFEGALETTHDFHPRWKLVDAVNHLVEQHAIPPEVAGRALTEALHVTPDQTFWENDSTDGLLILQEALEGWTEVAILGEPVPEDVVERAIELSGIEDPNTFICIIDLFQAAVASDSPATEHAFDALVDLTDVEEPTPSIRSEATLALAELVLRDALPDDETVLPDEERARDVLKANVDAVRREEQLVEQALAVLTT